LQTVLLASAGLFGVQVVWGLQNISTSRIFQTLGADVAELPILWIAAPLTGLLVQPLVGHLSDRSRSRFGRRRPFIAIGALLTSLGMLALGFAQTLAAAVVGLWVLTASANVTMQPLRALLADLLPADRRAAGYAVQVVLIGSGAVLASSLPWLLGHVFGIASSAPPGVVPATVRAAFALGAALVLAASFASLFAPDPPAPRFEPASAATDDAARGIPSAAQGAGFVLLGVALAALAFALGLRREIYLLTLISAGYGFAVEWIRAKRRSGKPIRGLLLLIETIALMPPIMRRLAIVQFFTWFGLFTLWVYAVPAVAARDGGNAAAAYNDSADRVGLFFAFFDAAAIVAALGLPALVRRLGLARSHQFCLVIGSIGLAGLVLIPDLAWSWIPAIGVGIAWASILSAPYTLVANSVPASKVGTYLGIHNIFLVVPQLVAAATLGALSRAVQAQSQVAMVWVAVFALLIAAMSCLLLRKDPALL
jgi:maltose/moltooligosaccharide transporter